jgi:signal transduction histidine kinase
MLIARDIPERMRIEAMKDSLLRDVSHELKTPLAKVQVSLELLLEKVAAEPVNPQGALRYGRTALDGVQHLSSMVSGILDLSRLEAGVGSFASETIALGELIPVVVQGMQAQAAEKGLTLTIDLAQALPTVGGDRERLAQVLRNLLDNALKFSSAGEIVVAAEVRDGEILVRVSDSGRGIAAENLGRVFERFFREDTDVGGIGVGLPMCKAIIEAHGGRIWAESAGRGMGATLCFALPVLSEQGRATTGEGGEKDE